ncbi:MAG: (d)CMP kinase [Bacteroidaceae bacterium]|nr:(d)CMP kinase [Bacteroidaceae bacterium]
MKKIIIAIDGHSSCGKSTMAKALAKKTGYTYIDTGAMYRAVTLFALRHGLIADGEIKADELERFLPQVSIGFMYDSEGMQHTLLDGEDVEREIRGMEVSQNVSPVSALPFVREAMVAQQRIMGQSGAIVMDGRDIGTTVFPNAELKIFVTARDDVRAQRRYDEMVQKGEDPVFEDVLENVRQRDWIDSHREVSPLRQADDAIVLDNSDMTIPQQDEWLMNHFIMATAE